MHGEGMPGHGEVMCGEMLYWATVPFNTEHCLVLLVLLLFENFTRKRFLLFDRF